MTAASRRNGGTRAPGALRRGPGGGWLPAALLVASCGGAPPPADTTPATGVAAVADGGVGEAGASDGGAPDPLAAARVVGRGEGADAAAAEAAARADLERVLLGEGQPWITGGWVDAPLHVDGLDLRREATEGEWVVVTLGLEADRVAGLLAALPDAALRLSGSDGGGGPEVLRGEAEALVRVALASLACARRAALLDDEAPADCPDEDAVDEARRRLAARVELREFWDGGVPLDDAGRPRRPLALHAVSPRRPDERGPTTRPLEDLRIELRRAGTGEPVGAAVSDAAGLAPIPWPDAVDPGAAAHPDDDAWAVPLVARIDARRWVGPAAAPWPGVDTPLHARRPGLARRVVVANVRARGERADGDAFARRLDAALEARGLPEPLFQPGRADRRTLLVALGAAVPPERIEGLPPMADLHRGIVDVALLVRVESAFASRMGAQRVWYEATGSVDVYDAWTGARVDRRTATATASGIGERRADLAARNKLAGALADALLADR